MPTPETRRFLVTLEVEVEESTYQESIRAFRLMQEELKATPLAPPNSPQEHADAIAATLPVCSMLRCSADQLTVELGRRHARGEGVALIGGSIALSSGSGDMAAVMRVTDSGVRPSRPAHDAGATHEPVLVPM